MVSLECAVGTHGYSHLNSRRGYGFTQRQPRGAADHGATTAARDRPQPQGARHTPRQGSSSGRKRKKATKRAKAAKEWRDWHSISDWHGVTSRWFDYAAAPVSTEVQPREAKGVPHVYVYILPVLRDGHTVMQMRDREWGHMGLIGGELELWKQPVRSRLAEETAQRAKNKSTELPPSIWTHARREAWEEAGIHTSDWEFCDAVVRERTSVHTHWHSVVVLVLARVRSCPNVRSLLTTCVPRAPHLGVETLAIVPVPLTKSIAALRQVFAFQKHHDVHLACLLHMHRMCSAWARV